MEKAQEHLHHSPPRFSCRPNLPPLPHENVRSLTQAAEVVHPLQTELASRRRAHRIEAPRYTPGIPHRGPGEFPGSGIRDPPSARQYAATWGVRKHVWRGGRLTRQRSQRLRVSSDDDLGPPPGLSAERHVVVRASAGSSGRVGQFPAWGEYREGHTQQRICALWLRRIPFELPVGPPPLRRHALRATFVGASPSSGASPVARKQRILDLLRGQLETPAAEQARCLVGPTWVESTATYCR